MAVEVRFITTIVRIATTKTKVGDVAPQSSSLKKTALGNLGR
jgi:hypothetical protein